jgi:aspartate/methionine/tyrosine aminotransferase
MLLAKGPVEEGWVDVALGEAKCVREQLKTFLPYRLLTSDMDLSYQPPSGWTPLKKYLEELHGKPVVITNGAKQALAALLGAAIDRDTLVTHSPYWSSFTRLAEYSHMEFSLDHDPNNSNVYLLASPGNPTGDRMQYPKELWKGAMVVHDAAYWSPAYDEECTDANLPPCHYRVYSMSKALGLSGLRVGYIVFEDDEFNLQADVEEYIETTTSGVSTASQLFVLQALRNIEASPIDAAAAFGRAREQMSENRMVFQAELGCAGDVVNEFGMFAWCRKGLDYDPVAAKVRVIDGAPFGNAGFFRVSLGGSTEECLEAAIRLRKAAIRLCKVAEGKKPKKKDKR